MNASPIDSELVGAWLLESYQSRLLDGADVQYPLGSDAIGILMYTSDGYMSAQIMRNDRPRFEDDDLQQAEQYEFASAAASYLAYSGPYTVTKDGSQVHHHLTASLFPNWVGSVQARVVTLEGDRLELGTASPVSFSGEQRTGHLVWRRAVPRS